MADADAELVVDITQNEKKKILFALGTSVLIRHSSAECFLAMVANDALLTMPAAFRCSPVMVGSALFIHVEAIRCAITDAEKRGLAAVDRCKKDEFVVVYESELSGSVYTFSFSDVNAVIQ